MDRILTYCASRQPLGCDFPIYYQPLHNGGGPFFIEKLFGTEEFLEEHKDCKSVLELCSGPGFIGFYLYNKLKLDFVNFIDIHSPVEDDIIKTASFNNVDYSFYLSDGFKSYNGKLVDLIVMNPPFYWNEKQFDNHVKYKNLKKDIIIDNDRRITLDDGFKLHTDIIKNFDKYLTDNGRIVFLENKNFVDKSMIFELLEKPFRYTFKQFDFYGRGDDYYTLTCYV